MKEEKWANGRPKRRPFKDITGQTFGKIHVLRMEITENSKNGEWRAICECLACGRKDYEIRPAGIKTLRTQTCGCDKSYMDNHTRENSSNYKGYKELSGKYVSGIKGRAKKRNIEFNIDAEYLWNLYELQNKKCALSGIILTFPVKTRLSVNSTASLDRIDSKKGYIIGNVQWVHKDINYMKNDLSDDVFIMLCNAVASNNKKEIPVLDKNIIRLPFIKMQKTRKKD